MIKSYHGIKLNLYHGVCFLFLFSPPLERYSAYVVILFCWLWLLVSTQREMKKPVIGKEYFKHMNLEAIVSSYPYRKNLPQEDIMKG